ncbi:hypothetical protein EST38_g7745 [Candolleomyces aberdarensis]|uniref:Uncharacterized protein n=1 Tax=Candolleomyces aberdarensis TaxID=2316362 RepID=A0A4Q2DGI0_9AGAR|nr:hypothetical protein EST38_g7745 [Candolleomyces aberdarensis]
MLKGCECIIIFTDSMAVARRSVDLSVHTGQAYSLAVCKALSEWFSGGGDRSLEFIGTLSKLEWGIHHQAHLASRSLPPIPAGRRPATSPDSVHKHITQTALDSWATRYQDNEYRGSQFLVMHKTKGNIIAPMYANGGSWLKLVGEDTRLCTRMCRAILNHAPIGEYYRRFNIQEDYSCTHGAERQTREHIFTRCPDLNTRRRTPKLLNELLGFLQQNPTAFGFCSAPEGIG